LPRNDYLILGENGGNGDSGLVFNIVFPDKTVKTIVLEKDKYYLTVFVTACFLCVYKKLQDLRKCLV